MYSNQEDRHMQKLSPRLILGAVLMGVTLPAAAFIDPDFTPRDLVQSADTIVELTATSDGDGASRWDLTVTGTLKGEAPDRIALTITEDNPSEAVAVEEALIRYAATGMVAFIGEFEAESVIHLHAGNRWILVHAQEGEDWAWGAQAMNGRMNGTFDGGTDTLGRMTRYLLTYPDGIAPITVGTRWFDRLQPGHVPESVLGMLWLQPFGDQAAPHIHIISSGGDRLFRSEGDDTFEDVSDDAGLTHASRHAAWMRPDPTQAHPSLFSAQDGAIHIYELNDGALQPAGTIPLEADCLGLAEARLAATPALLISTPDHPLLAFREGDGQWRLEALETDEALLQASGPGATAVAADLNGSGYVDILQPREHHGLLWRGSADGFAPAIATAVTRGGSPQPAMALGDFSANGRLSLFVSGIQESELWDQTEDGAFRRTLPYSGSLAYKAPAGAEMALTTDLNHDGRPDLAILYETTTAMYHFNRGYRAMGEEGELPLDGMLVAAVAADLNEDGSIDLFAARRDGVLFYYANDMFDVPSVAVSLGDGIAGPVTVSVWQGTEDAPYCVGTESVVGKRPSIIPLRRAGPAQLRWRLPGRAEQITAITVGNRMQPVTVE